MGFTNKTDRLNEVWEKFLITEDENIELLLERIEINELLCDSYFLLGEKFSPSQKKQLSKLLTKQKELRAKKKTASPKMRPKVNAKLKELNAKITKLRNLKQSGGDKGLASDKGQTDAMEKQIKKNVKKQRDINTGKGKMSGKEREEKAARLEKVNKALEKGQKRVKERRAEKDSKKASDTLEKKIKKAQDNVNFHTRMVRSNNNAHQRQALQKAKTRLANLKKQR